MVRFHLVTTKRPRQAMDFIAALMTATSSFCMAWTEFDKYGSSDKKDKSRILFLNLKMADFHGLKER